MVYYIGTQAFGYNSLAHHGVKGMEWGKHKFGLDANTKYINWMDPNRGNGPIGTKPTNGPALYNKNPKGVVYKTGMQNQQSTPASNGFGARVSSAYTDASNWVGSQARNVGSTVSGAYDSVSNWARSAARPVQNAAIVAGRETREFLTGENAKRMMESDNPMLRLNGERRYARTLPGMTENAIKKIKEVGGELISRIKESKVYKDASAWLSGARKWATESWGRVKEKGKEFLKAGREIIDKAIGAVKGAYKSAREFVTGGESRAAMNEAQKNMDEARKNQQFNSQMAVIKGPGYQDAPEGSDARKAAYDSSQAYANAANRNREQYNAAQEQYNAAQEQYNRTLPGMISNLVNSPQAQNIGQNIGNAANWVGNQAQNIGQNIGNAANWVGNQAQNIGQNIGNAANWVGNQAQNVGQNIGNAANWVGNQAQNVGQNIGNAANWVSNQAQNIGQNVGNAYNNASQWVGDQAQKVGQVVNAYNPFGYQAQPGQVTDAGNSESPMPIAVPASDRNGYFTYDPVSGQTVYIGGTTGKVYR